jgi:hypothetical protein
LFFSVNKSLEDKISDHKSLLNVDKITVEGNLEMENDKSYLSIFPSPSSSKLQFFVKMYCVLSMLGLWSSNFNIIADQNMGEGPAFQKFLTTFPNYFLYALTVTLWSYQETKIIDIQQPLSVLKWVLLALSFSLFIVSMITLFK